VSVGSIIHFYGGSTLVDQSSDEVQALLTDSCSSDMVELSLAGHKVLIRSEDVTAVVPNVEIEDHDEVHVDHLHVGVSTYTAGYGDYADDALGQS
jgi:hypothetical protein